MHLKGNIKNKIQAGKLGGENANYNQPRIVALKRGVKRIS